MDFYINKNNLNVNGGPYNFSNLLEKEFLKKGLKKNFFFPKINLLFSNGYIRKFSKNILRLDGIYIQDLNDKKIKINENIFKTIINSDGVIYQSEFSKDIIQHHLINNGINIKAIRSAVIPNAFTDEFFLESKIIDRNFNYKNIYLTITRRSKNKRLKYIIEAFKL